MEETKQGIVKICKECGSTFFEKQVSVLYECERCIGRHEE